MQLAITAKARLEPSIHREALEGEGRLVPLAPASDKEMALAPTVSHSWVSAHLSRAAYQTGPFSRSLVEVGLTAVERNRCPGEIACLRTYEHHHEAADVGFAVANSA